MLLGEVGFWRLNDVINNATLLHDICHAGSSQSTPTTLANYWVRDSRIVELLEYGSEDSAYAMDRVDIERFPVIAPKIRSTSSEIQTDDVVPSKARKVFSKMPTWDSKVTSSGDANDDDDGLDAPDVPKQAMS